MSLVLTKPELIELTGYKHRQKQMRELSYLGYPYRVTSTGRVLVLRSDVESPKKREEPDFEAI